MDLQYNMYAISVVIPVYNVASYIEDCLQSVASQTFSESIECLLIDDCGQDESVALCEKFISSYQGKIAFRIVHHDRNKGLSAARNTGINEARGKYIGFIDSDDYIDPSYFQILYREAQAAEGNVSIVACCCYTDQEGVIASFANHPIPRQIIEPTEYASAMLLEKVPHMAWGKLFRREIFSKIRFREGKNNEDSLFALDFYPEVEKKQIQTLIIPDQLYYYRIRPNSICTSKSKPFFVDVIGNIEEIMGRTRSVKPDIYQVYRKDYLYQLVKAISVLVYSNHILHKCYLTYVKKLYKFSDFYAYRSLQKDDFHTYLYQKYLTFVYLKKFQ